jgi:hypothetical protein
MTGKQKLVHFLRARARKTSVIVEIYIVDQSITVVIDTVAARLHLFEIPAVAAGLPLSVDAGL